MRFYEYSAFRLDGSEQHMAEYQGKVVLIVNTASKCGFTPQYKELEALYQKYKDQGLMILGFPCNQFSNQEPGTSEDIMAFCDLTYGVTFPMFQKIEVNGPNTHSLYRYLKKSAKGLLGGTIKWNFTKFLIGRDGVVLKRYAPAVSPLSLEPKIKAALNATPDQ